MKRFINRERLSRIAACAMFTCTVVAVHADADSQPDAGSSSYSDLFEKAVFAEESLGDLDSAIKLYRQLLDHHQDDKGVVAQAHYRLGLCYLKKGRPDDAIAELERLVDEFPAQHEIVATARRRLAGLGVAQERAALSLRKIWSNAGATLGSPSVDGRFLSFTDWSTGDLAVHDVQSGKDRRVTDKGSWDSPSYAEFSVPSPDGKQIAYAWFIGPGLAYDLRVVDVDGSEPRVVLKNEDVHWLQPLAWSTDGDAIFVELVFTAGDQLGWVDVRTGAFVPVGPRRDYLDGTIDLSPDKRRVAFSLEQSEDTRRRDIFVTELSSGQERVLLDHPADDRVVGWAPDGSSFIFLSDRTGEWGLWSADLVDGHVVGEPRLIKAGMGQLWPNGQLLPMGFTGAGQLYYGMVDDTSDIYTAGLGSGDNTPVRATQRFEGSNFAPEWSADGQYLAWISRRDGGYTIVVRNTSTGDDREVDVSNRLTRFLGGGWGGIRWSPDNNFILVPGMARPQESWQGLFSIDVETGEIEQQVVAAADNAVRVPVWAPDGRTLYFTRMDAIVSKNLETGEETNLYTGNVGNIALSPDGQQLAFTTDAYTGAVDHMLKVIPTTGGQPRDVFRSKETESFAPTTSLFWTPDGKHLVFSSGLTQESEFEESEVELWQVPVQGGARKRLGIKMPYLRNAGIHPDGKRVVFQAGDRNYDVWVMENFFMQGSISH